MKVLINEFRSITAAQEKSIHNLRMNLFGKVDPMPFKSQNAIVKVHDAQAIPLEQSIREVEATMRRLRFFIERLLNLVDDQSEEHVKSLKHLVQRFEHNEQNFVKSYLKRDNERLQRSRDRHHLLIKIMEQQE